METRELGRSGVRVSRVILGCGNFGGVGSDPAYFGRGTPKATAFALMDAAWDLGITTFDTADAYGGGRSEAWIGEWLRSKGPSTRDDIVLGTKTFSPMAEGADRGLAPRRIRRQIDTSLARLGVDRVAMYLPHAFDSHTPQAETLAAFAGLVRAGKVGAVGASNFSAGHLAEALEISERDRLARYEWVQNSFSLLDRSDAGDVFAMCRERELGYTPFSPLAGGWLTGKYRRGEPPPAGSRMTQRPSMYAGYETDRVFDGLEALRDEASSRGASMAALAMAWLLHVPEVTAIIVGPNRLEHMTSVEEALAIRLTESECASLASCFE